MTYSPLINRAAPPTTKKWSPRPAGTRINGMIVHHWASTSMAGYQRLVESRDQASANYLILNDGTLIGSVPEEYRAWTSGSAAADNTKVTVEVQNETGGPEWRISAAALATLARLYADVAQRRGFAADRAHISGHRDHAATACPGPYLYPRLGQVASEAGGATHVDKVTPTAPAPTKPSGLTPDGYWGAATTTRLQQVLGTPADGVVSHQTPVWRAKNPGLTTGWDWTGKAGDGGSQVIAALQRRIGVEADGKIGPDTIKALQRHLGTLADGAVSERSRMVIALQQRLNEDRV